MVKGGGQTEAYKYDTNNRLIMPDGVTANYSGNLLTEFTYAGNNVTFTYDEKGVLTQFVSKSGEDVATVTYKYNAHQQLIEIKSINIVKGNPFYGYNEFAYPNTTTKDPASVKFYKGDANGKTGNPYQTTLLTYDGKRECPVFSPPCFENYSPFATSNIVKETTNGESTTYAYQYNSSGYPVSRTYTMNGQTQTEKYIYDCK
jgi:YD repeat-containing protein